MSSEMEDKVPYRRLKEGPRKKGFVLRKVRVAGGHLFRTLS